MWGSRFGKLCSQSGSLFDRGGEPLSKPRADFRVVRDFRQKLGAGGIMKPNSLHLSRRRTSANNLAMLLVVTWCGTNKILIRRKLYNQNKKHNDLNQIKHQITIIVVYAS